MISITMHTFFGILRCVRGCLAGFDGRKRDGDLHVVETTDDTGIDVDCKIRFVFREHARR